MLFTFLVNKLLFANNQPESFSSSYLLKIPERFTEDKKEGNSLIINSLVINTKLTDSPIGSPVQSL